MRTFKQLGQGFSNAPATIIAKIDGTVVYMGPVPTVNEPLPADYTSVVTRGWGNDGKTSTTDKYLQSLFAWQQPLDFRGTQQLEVTVTSGRVLTTRTVANNTDIEGTLQPKKYLILTDFFFWPDGEFTRFHPGDPLSNVLINGRAPTLPATSKGQLYWLLSNGDVLTATLSMDLPPQP
jgi:hypothetical protein